QVERRVTQSTAAEVKQAIDVAHRAFADWSRTTPLRRARIMFNFKALLEQHRDELAELIVIDAAGAGQRQQSRIRRQDAEFDRALVQGSL
ncbi:aldehyde dehydrogenase family protein, partial [Escherichia coli]|nr:aldehyde dehydrogenase family protein [Escherichia coli]